MQELPPTRSLPLLADSLYSRPRDFRINCKDISTISSIVKHAILLLDWVSSLGLDHGSLPNNHFRNSFKIVGQSPALPKISLFPYRQWINHSFAKVPFRTFPDCTFSRCNRLPKLATAQSGASRLGPFPRRYSGSRHGIRTGRELRSIIQLRRRTLLSSRKCRRNTACKGTYSFPKSSIFSH